MTFQYGEFVVQHGIPLPRPLFRAKYPFAIMEVGDSFFAPCKRRVNGQESVTVAARKFAKSKGMRFASRTLTEDGVRGVRVWRVA